MDIQNISRLSSTGIGLGTVTVTSAVPHLVSILYSLVICNLVFSQTNLYK